MTEVVEAEIACGNCRWWVADIGNMAQGQCRADTPRAILVPLQSLNPAQQGFGIEGVWPPTKRDGWCSHHARKQERY